MRARDSHKVPHWVRNRESARMLVTFDKPLHMLGLGMSIGTSPGGIIADGVVVSNFNELAKLGREKVEGRIVVYNYVFTNYGSGRNYCTSGASPVAALGAVASLVRSATPLAMQTSHTGTVEYDPARPKIPADATTREDPHMLYADGVPVRLAIWKWAHNAARRR